MEHPAIAIVANGQPPHKSVLARYLPETDILIAADGGANICRAKGLNPDFIVGDLDSISEENRQYFGKARLIARPDQNFSDLQKAVTFALSHTPRSLVIFSAFGLRGDHSFSNLLLAASFESDLPILMPDNQGELSWLNAGHHQLQGSPGMPISFFSIQPIQHLILNGFEYDVEDMDFNPFFNGCSNQIKITQPRLSFEGGPLFVYRPFNELQAG